MTFPEILDLNRFVETMEYGDALDGMEMSSEHRNIEETKGCTAAGTTDSADEG